jgi:hypothetical protein
VLQSFQRSGTLEKLKEHDMKRVQVVLAALVASVCMAPGIYAQMGMNFFKKPNIADIFRPVVGNGSVYEQQHKDGKKSMMEMIVVGKDMVDGREAYWVEFGHDVDPSGAKSYVKMLVTKDDFQFHKMIMQMPGSAQPMEMPFNPSMKTRQKMQEEMEKWHSVGTESVTVPAGTFSCEHWTKDNGKGDVWVSSKVSPMSMVKSVDNGETMVLLKTLTGAKDHITGTPVKFDPQLFRQQMMEQMEKNKQP